MKQRFTWKVCAPTPTRQLAGAAILAAILSLAGCGGGGVGGGSKPVPLDAAFNHASADDPRRGPVTERPAHSMYNDVSIDPLHLQPTPTEGESAQSNSGPPTGVIAEPVREAVQPPVISSMRAAATQASPST